MFQRQIDPRGEKARREHQTADLHLETGVTPRVLAHDETADVADEFAKGAETDGEHEGPCSGVGADYELREEEEPEEGAEEDVCAEGGVVAVEGFGYGAFGGYAGAETVGGVVWHVEVGGPYAAKVGCARLVGQLSAG